jgi:hypothetical protein
MGHPATVELPFESWEAYKQRGGDCFFDDEFAAVEPDNGKPNP